jgi:hypothetical protein
MDMTLYQKIAVATGEPIGEPGPLPAELVGLEQTNLDDLSWIDPALGYTGVGFLPVRDLDAERAAARAAVTARRKVVEAGGTVVNGVPVRTDEGSQSRISGAIAFLDRDPEATVVNWEAQPGLWVALDKAQLVQVGIAVGRHVQATFSRACALHAAINASDEPGSIDIETGWPSNS